MALPSYFGVVNNNKKKYGKELSGNTLCTLASFFPFATMAVEGPTGHLMSYWCFFSVSEADDSRWLTGMLFFAKFLLESRTEASTFSWDGNLSADSDQEASPLLGLYMQPAPTRMVTIRFTGKVRPFTFTGNMPEGRHSQVFPKHLFSFPSNSLLLDHIGVNTFYLTDVECYSPDSTRVCAGMTFNFRRFGQSLYFSVNISYNPLSQNFAPWEELVSFHC